MTLHANEAFAPLDRDHFLKRIAGGNETEVYLSDDGRYVVKLKQDMGGDVSDALDWARTMRAAAEEFGQCLGPQHSIPNYYLISRDNDGQIQVLVIQPYVANSRPLYTIDYNSLNADERSHIARQLRDIIRRSLAMYRMQGRMPDLYGRSTTSSKERKQLNAPSMLPWRLWSFLVQRNLLRSHNLMVTSAPEYRIVFIDYDIVRRSKLYRSIYYTVRWLLFWRDHFLIWLMKRGGPVPKA